jgi:putative membrane protein
MHRVIRRSKIAALCTVGLVAACAKGDKTADSARPADSASASMGAPASGTGAAPETGWTDPNIMAFLDNANMADSAAGSVAASKGTSADVKAFGKEMVRDHHAMRREGQDLAKKINVAPAPKPGDTMAAESAAFQDTLTSMPRGTAWDRTYIDHEVIGHEKVLTAAQAAAGSTQNADIKTLITKAAPKVQEHLDKAKKIQAKLAGAK